MSQRLFGLALGLGLGACAAPPSGDAGVLDAGCSAAGVSVEMGVGRDASFANYRPFVDGDTVYLTPGPQGGQHLWVQLRGRGFDPTQPRIELTARRARDGVVIGRLRIRLRMSPAPEDPSMYGLSSQTLVIDDDQYCSVMPGDIVVSLAFSDGFGRCTTLERRLHIEGIDPAALAVDREARTRCCAERLPRCYPPDAGL